MAGRYRVALTLKAFVLTALVLSCSDEPATGTNKPRDGGSTGTTTCPAYKVPANTNLMDPVTSLRKDVLPILAPNCSTIKACHGTGTNHVPINGDSSAVHAALVGVASGELPRMPFVKAGDPSQSYLMHKMDGDQCLYDKECNNGYCQDTMPSSAPVLDANSRLIVRRWIAQGAKND